MSYYWSCEPQQLLWVGGTYARDPKHFPACQQETAWIYANLRPLRIQPPIELMRLHGRRAVRELHYYICPETSVKDEEREDVS